MGWGLVPISWFTTEYTRQLSENSTYKLISHVRNEQGTGYEYSISIELKNEPCDLKEHLKVSLFTKLEIYLFKRKGMVLF